MPQAVPYIALGISAGSTVASISEQRKARKASVRANRAQERAAAIQNARARRRSAAEARQVQASTIAAGVSQGIGGSSTIEGISSSIQSQLSSNLSFQQQLQNLDAERFSALRTSLGSQSRASSFAQLSQLSGQFSGPAVNKIVGK